MALLDEFAVVSRRRRCPVCQRPKFCLVERATESDPARVVCTKIESAHRWGEAGWLHVLRQGMQPPPLRIRTLRSKSEANPDFAPTAARFREALADETLAAAASALGLTAGSLERLGVGWASSRALDKLRTPCHDLGCLAFPMSDGRAGQVVGVRLRTQSGFKFAVVGSKQGLFIPADLEVCDRLLISEGPTDTAALLDLGFAVVGRPSCSAGTKHVVALAQRLRPPAIVIVADADEPGLKGAQALASVLAVYVADVRVIRPPEGIKDARAWKNASPTADAVIHHINQAIDAAIPQRLAITFRKAGC